MASLRVRNIDETTMGRLRQGAESNKRSLEQEALRIIETHLSYALKTDPFVGQYGRMQRSFAAKSGAPDDSPV
jgi:plasmid stability protein